jgi:hypothetical protein
MLHDETFLKALLEGGNLDLYQCTDKNECL